jgi:hypothetical protein
MELSIEPRQGIGPIRLGMTRAESRAAIDMPPLTYQKVPGSRLVDTYQDSAPGILGVSGYFSSDG